jgi:hypothetical protein
MSGVPPAMMISATCWIDAVILELGFGSALFTYAGFLLSLSWDLS